MTVKTEKINITPDKSIFPKIGQTGYTVAQALSELIDNSIDARDKSVEVYIKIDKKQGFIAVEDNGIGMNKEAAVNSIKLGSSQKKEGELGQFGIGLKAACMSLGKKFTLETSTKGIDEEYIIVFDEDDFLKNGNWSDFEIKIKTGADKNSSFTRIKIEKLKIKFFGTFFDFLKKHLSERFTPFIRNNEVKIKVNREVITQEPFDIFPDTKKDFSIKLSNGEIIKGWTGILKVGSVERSGFNLYRYKRLIRVHEKLGYVYHPSKMAITGEIYMDPLPVTINKREFNPESELYIEFFNKFSEYLKPILAEAQKRSQEEKIKDLPREIRETLKDNILRALNETSELKELAFPGGDIKKRSKNEEGELSAQEAREESEDKVGVAESITGASKGRTPKKVSSNMVRFITIAGKRYRFDYTWGAIEESVAKQAYLDKDKNTIMVILNNHYHILKALPKIDLFYHIVYLTEGIVEVFLKENHLSLDKVIELRDKLTQQLADVMTEDEINRNIEKDSNVINAQSYLLESGKHDTSLRENEQFVLESRLNGKLTYQEIADKLKVTRQRVEQIFRSAVNKINNINKIVERGVEIEEQTEKTGQTEQAPIVDVKRANVDSIIENTAKAYNVSIKDLLGNSRQAELVLPRHTVMYLLRKELGLSFPGIAKIMGKKDHTSIVYAYNKMKEIIETKTEG